MSDGYRNGAFALGLAVGGGLAINLFLWFDYQQRKVCESDSENCQQQDYSEVGRYWDGLFGTFVSPSDTLAQWIMALFTIAATGVLILTLRSANRTNKAAVSASEAALKANEIMRAEQRPWVKIELALIDHVTFDGEAVRVAVRWKITNIGSYPADTINVHIEGSPFPFDTRKRESRRFCHRIR